MTAIIRGGIVVTASDQFPADVLIRDGRIEALGDGSAWTADQVIDASGCFVLPGGVDTHTHLKHMSANGHTRTADDFYSGTIAAVAGGTTTIVDFVRGLPGEGIYDAYLRRVDEASAEAVVDFAFHPIVPGSAGEDDSFDQLVRLRRELGAVSWKFFMAYPGSMVSDDVLIRGFRLCRDEGVLPMVHAENGHMIADAIAGMISAGQVAEHEHLHAHPDVSEQEAVHRAIGLAEYVGTPLFIVHVSSGQAVDEILAGQQRGLDVIAETCPQYLVTGYEDYASLGFGAAGYACSPPIRERSNQERLWRGLAEGTLSTIGTDHAAFTLGQPDDLPPQKGQGRGYFPSIPNGVPGVEERLMVMYQAGVIERGLSMSRLVELTSTAPAKTFGLYPRKGLLAPGSDADIVVWDPSAPRTLGVAGQHSRADYSVYEDYEVSGSPRHVMARGELVVSHGELDATRGRGSYIVRASPSSLSVH